MKKLDVLISQLDDHISFFEKESSKHKKLHRQIRYAIIASTALSTVFASMAAASILDPYINIIVVIITATTGVLSSIESLRKPSELWLHERSIYHALEDLRREINFHNYGLDQISEETVNNYFMRAQSLLSQGSEKWRQDIYQNPKNKDTSEQAKHSN